MSAQLKEVFSDGTLAGNRSAAGYQGISPRRRRFGLNPGIYMMQMHPRESGRQEILLPVGLIPFRSADMAAENFSIENVDEGHYQHQIIDTDNFTARYFIENVKIRYAEHGFRELPSLTLMEDPQPNEKGNVTKEQLRKSAQGYFEAMWPPFAEVGHQCPAELAECVTCRLWLLTGDAPDRLDRPVMNESIRERANKLEDQPKVDELWAEIIATEVAFEEASQARWAAIVGELADRKTGAPAIAKLGPGEQHVRRHLHAVEPSEAATAAGFGMEVAAAQAESMEKLAVAFREGKGSGDNSELLKLVLETQRQQAELLAKLSDKLPTEAKEPVKE